MALNGRWVLPPVTIEGRTEAVPKKIITTNMTKPLAWTCGENRWTKYRETTDGSMQSSDVFVVCMRDGSTTSLSGRSPFSPLSMSREEVMAVFKGCHQTSPKFYWRLSLKIVIKHRPKFYWSDGCLSRLSSKAAQSSTEVMAVFKD